MFGFLFKRKSAENATPEKKDDSIVLKEEIACAPENASNTGKASIAPTLADNYETNDYLESHSAAFSIASASHLHDFEYSKPQPTYIEKSRIVLLTMSGKHNGACVSGIDLLNNKFIRFVSNAEDGRSIPFYELNGINKLDIIEAEKIRNCPIGIQSENILIRKNSIKKVGQFSGAISNLANEITYPDRNSILSFSQNSISDVSSFSHSLELVLVQNLSLRKYTKYNGDVTTRASFIFNGKRHNDYRVTDFDFDLRKSESASIDIPNAYIVLSLPKDPYIVPDGRNYGYYKFIASIFPVHDVQLPVLQSPSITTELKMQKKPQNNSVDNKSNSYELWTDEEDNALIAEYKSGMSYSKIAEKHKRSYGAIVARLKKKGLIK